jgi:DNA topoisomerase VI subunit A
MITDIQIDADYLLIIEKETVFNHFLFGEYQKYLGKIIIATGKGYPDYSIKKFLKKINFLYPDLIYFYLGDYDPYGIDILMNYTFSSEK